MVRHPIPVSYATQRLYRRFHRLQRPSIATLIRHWIRAQEVFERDAPRVQPLSVVRYEDLIQRPEEVLNRVARDVDIPAEFSSLPVAVETARSDAYLASWRNHLSDPILGRRRERQARALDARVQRWRYSLFEG